MEIIIDNDKKQIPALLAQRESEYSELVTKQEKLNSLQSDYNYTDIKNAKNQAESKVAEYEAIFNQMKLSNINIITIIKNPIFSPQKKVFFNNQGEIKYAQEVYLC